MNEYNQLVLKKYSELKIDIFHTYNYRCVTDRTIRKTRNVYLSTEKNIVN